MSSNLIEYLVSKKRMLHKDIATHLGVSRAQVSRWKAGEMIPLERQKALQKLAGLFTDDVQWAAIVRTAENGKAWARYLQWWDELHIFATEGDAEWRTESILKALSYAGVRVPCVPPTISDDEDGNDSPVDNLFGDFMEDLAIYLSWLWRFMDHDINEAREIEDQLELHAIYLALQLVPDEVLVANGAKPKQVKQYCNDQSEAARQLIQEYCEVLQKKEEDIMVDYFMLVDADTTSLDSMCLMPRNTIENYLTYAERTTFYQMQATHHMLAELRDMLQELHAKVDKIVSEST